MTPDLSRRIAAALTRGSATMAEGDALVAAAGPPDVRSIDDLPPDAANLVREMETRETVLNRMSMAERWAADDAYYAAHPRAAADQPSTE